MIAAVTELERVRSVRRACLPADERRGRDRDRRRRRGDVGDGAIPGRAGAAHRVSERASTERVVSAPVPIARSGTEAGFGLAWAGPPISDEREATALDFVADYLFAPDTGTVQRSAGGRGERDLRDVRHLPRSGRLHRDGDGRRSRRRRAGGDRRGLERDAQTAARARRKRSPMRGARSSTTSSAMAKRPASSARHPTAGTRSRGSRRVRARLRSGTRGRYPRRPRPRLSPAFVAATVAKYLGRSGASVNVRRCARPRNLHRRRRRDRTVPARRPWSPSPHR